MAKPGNPKLENILNQRWSTLGHLALRLGLLTVLFFQVNYLGCRHYRTLDLSRNQQFSISDQTSGFLRGLGGKVEIITAFLGTSDILPEVKGILNEYDRIGGDQIAVENLDLSRSRSRITELRDKYKLDLNREQVAIISESGRVKIIGAEELVSRDAATGRILEFLGEEKITSALLEVTEQQQKKVYLITGDRTLGLVPIAQQLLALTNSQNTRLEQLILKGRQSIPADADALIFAGNTQDLTRPEVDLVRAYWEDRRGGLVILLDPAAATPNLNSLLRDNGVIPRADRVLSGRSIPGLGFNKIYQVPVTIMPGPGPTRDLPILSMLLMERTQSMDVQIDSEIYRSKNIRPYPLLIAGESFWGEREHLSEVVSFDPDEDAGPENVYVAAAIEKGLPDDVDFKQGVSRLVAVGNPNLISPDGNTSKTASDFCMASINWVMKRDQLLGIAPRKPTSYEIYLRNSTFGLLQSLIIWVLPVVLLFCGALVWYRRRA
jgi:ABC-type uncharacterized transport system